MAYADLQHPSPGTATYADIWAGAIEANNRTYVSRGDRRFASGNAPATEAHFVVWSARRSAVLSILDTATDCRPMEARPEVGATIKLCPMRLAVYEGIHVETMDGGRACFLELAAPSSVPRDPSSSMAYASYEPVSRTIRTGLIVDHRVVDGCSSDIAVPPP